MAFAKNCVEGFNVMFMVIGLIMVGAGIYGYVETEWFANRFEILKDFNLKDVCWALAALGGALFMTSLIGFCGAMKDAQQCLALYSCILFVVLACQCAILVFLYLSDDTLEDHVLRTMRPYYVVWAKSARGSADRTKIMEFQTNFECCGFDSTEDPYAVG